MLKTKRATIIVVIFFVLSVQPVFADTVKINEFVSHPSADNKEWVELYIPDNTDVTSYWIDDDNNFVADSGSSSKKSLSTIQQGKDRQHAFIELSSMLNNSSDSVVLFDNAGNILDQYVYTEDPGEDISIGRAPDGIGEFTVLAFSTKGDSNSMPQPTATPIVLPTPTPTKIPTPTHTPNPTKTPIPTKSPTPTKAALTKQNIASGPTTFVQTKKPVVTPASSSAFPTSILGVSTYSAKISPTRLPKSISSRMKNVADQRYSRYGIFVIIGGGLLSACAILVFLKMRKAKQIV